MRWHHDRYICSSGEKESKSALGLFDDFLKDWVCAGRTFSIMFSGCRFFFFGSMKLPKNKKTNKRTSNVGELIGGLNSLYLYGLTN